MFENFALAAVGIQLILNFLKAKKKEGLTFFLGLAKPPIRGSVCTPLGSYFQEMF